MWVPHSSRHVVTRHTKAQVSGDAKGGALLDFPYSVRPPPFAYGEEWGTRRPCDAAASQSTTEFSWNHRRCALASRTRSKHIGAGPTSSKVIAKV